MSGVAALVGDLISSAGGTAAAGGPASLGGTTGVGSSGDPGIDGLIYGWKWAVGSFTFSFPTSGTLYEYTGEAQSSFEQLNALQRASVRQALDMFSSVANVDFTETVETATNHADIRFAMSDQPPTAYAYFPGDTPQGGDIWFHNTGGTYDRPLKGTYAFHTVLHEIGHALGLKHGHEDGLYGVLPEEIDSNEFSLMTYRSYIGSPGTYYTIAEGHGAQSLMMYDIAALQHMYGANFDRNSGDTVYTWSPTTGTLSINGVGQGASTANKVFITIWDGGGIDTYDLSGYTTNVTIDLTPGAWSTTSKAQLADLDLLNPGTQIARGNIANALLFEGDTRSLIENAFGGRGNDTILGNDADNYLKGNLGNDTLTGGLGNDTLDGGLGVDILDGGDGDDTYVIDRLTDVIIDTDGVDRVDVAFSGYTLADDMENGGVATKLGQRLTGNAGDNMLYGNIGHDVLIGGDGNDQIMAGAGNDTLDGGVGDDTMYGGTGDDRYVIDSAGDVVVENVGEGRDTVLVGIDGYVLTDNVENGSLAFDTGGSLTGNGLDNVLTGGTGDDALSGDAGKDVLVGGLGNDTLDGGLGNDTMRGGLGDDTYKVDSLGDVVSELLGQGYDTVDVSISGYTLALNIERGRIAIDTGATLSGNALANELLGGLGDDTLNGGAGADTLLGDDGNDTLNGGIGADRMEGGNGDDTYLVDSLLDTIVEYGGEGMDRVIVSISNYTLAEEVEDGAIGTTRGMRLNGNALDNVLTGNAGADQLYGGDGMDLLIGGLGNDLLVGGIGDDTLSGGAGADRFQFALGDGMDTITDFVAGAASFDTIRLLGTGITRFADLAPLMSQVGSDVVIALDATSQITLQNVQLTTLNAGDFLFA